MKPTWRPENSYIPSKSKQRWRKNLYKKYITWKQCKIGVKFIPENRDSTRLQELSLTKTLVRSYMTFASKWNSTIPLVIFFFLEKSLSEHGTIHPLRELKRIPMLPSLAPAVLKLRYLGYFSQATDQVLLITRKTIFGSIHAHKNLTAICIRRCYWRVPILYKIKHCVCTLSGWTHFWEVAVLCGSEYNHNVVQPNANQDKKIMSSHTLPHHNASLKTISTESIRPIARNPTIDLQSIGIYSKPNVKHHILPYILYTTTSHYCNKTVEMDGRVNRCVEGGNLGFPTRWGSRQTGWIPITMRKNP